MFSTSCSCGVFEERQPLFMAEHIIAQSHPLLWWLVYFKDSLEVGQSSLLMLQPLPPAFFFSPWQLCPALILEIQFFPTCCDALGRLCSCLAPKTLFYHCWSLLSVSKSACGCSCSFLTRYYHFHCYITLSLPLEKKIQKEKKNQLFQTRFNFWFGTLPIKHISNPIQSPVVSLNIFQPVDRNILFQTCHQILDDHLSPCVLIT